MSLNFSRERGVGWRRTSSLAVLALAALVALPAGSRAAESEARAVLYVQEPRPLDRIPPGLSIGAAAPEGWSHLIVKSQPRLAPGEAQKVFPVVAKHATLLFTAILADVVRDPREQDFVLGRLAVGFGTRVSGQDVTVSSATAKQQGAELGLVGGMILSQSEQRLSDFMLLARTPTLAVFDIPGIVLIDERHLDMLMRYAVLVDKQTGKLQTLLWLLSPTKTGNYRLASAAMRRVTPGVIEDCLLHVDTAEITAGVPSARAFAVFGAPPGQDTTIPESLMPLLERRTLDFEWLTQLERGLVATRFPEPAK